MRQMLRQLPWVRTFAIGFLALGLAGCLSISDPPKGLSILTIVAGNNQIVPVNTTATDALVVKAFDETTSPMAGVVVTWTLSSGTGTLSTTTSTTDDSGLASVTYKAGTTTGSVNVKATAKDLNVTFTEVVQ